MTMARTDIHRPSAAEFDPQDYRFFDVYDNSPDFAAANLAFLEARKTLHADGWTHSGVHGGTGQCDHCGALLRYAALMLHVPTHTYIYVGEQCMDNRFEHLTKAAFQAARKSAQLDRERQAKLAAFNELCADMPELIWATYAYNIGVAGATYETRPRWMDEPDGEMVTAPVAGTTWAERNRKDWAIGVLSDLVRKVRQYGSFASEKQAKLLVKLVHELEEAEAVTAKREAERAAKAAARVNAAIGEVGDRRDFEGTVRWFDHYENSFGYTATYSTVIIIDTPEGTVKWTASKWIELKRGQAIKVKATIKEHSIYDKTQEITTVVTRGKML